MLGENIRVVSASIVGNAITSSAHIKKTGREVFVDYTLTGYSLLKDLLIYSIKA